jgi:hypothetical protein
MNPTHAPTGAPEGWYTQGQTQALNEVEQLRSSLKNLSRGRFLAFFGGIVPLLLLETTPRGGWPLLLGLSLISLLTFGGLVQRHRRVRTALRAAEMRSSLYGEGLARLKRDWTRLPEIDLGTAPEGHPWAVDLDVLGFGSLSHLLGTPRTYPGKLALRTALLGDAQSSPSMRAAHREAVAQLAEDPERLIQIQLAARLSEGEEAPRAVDTLMAWGEAEPWKPPIAWPYWVWLGRGSMGLNLVLVALWFGGTPPFWIAGMAVSGFLWVQTRAAAHAQFDAVQAAYPSLARWSALLREASHLSGDATLLRTLRDGATRPDEAAQALRDLQRISDWAEIRQSSLIYIPLALLTAWDIHPLANLERWRRRHGHRIRNWMDGVGTLERLTAFALLRHDHPDWILPFERSPESERPGLRARHLTHPLLPPSHAVGNDLEIPGPGKLLLLTGSNMSGKSTLLRAVGVNQILLLAGAPVAAHEYDASPVAPWTSMRIRDSLTQGVSLFMAELKRLRQVVDAARNGPVLVLLDEILQGTNTAERRTAARIILSHLLAAGACGAVSTHDLTLAEDPELAGHLEQVHLRESVVEVDGVRTLTFDHRLRAGPATSRNALILLDMVGLGPKAD